MQRGPASELATYDALRPDVFPPSGPFCPKKTRSVVNQKRREISKSRNIWLPRVNRTENRLVDGGPQLAEGLASPAFGFSSVDPSVCRKAALYAIGVAMSLAPSGD